MVFGIQDLQADVEKFQQDLENAKAKYMDEYAEYVNIATDLDNITQKDDFLHEEVEAIARVFPEAKDNSLSDSTKNLLISGGVFLSVSGIGFMVSKFNARKLINVKTNIGNLQNLQRAARNELVLVRRAITNARGVLRNTPKTVNTIRQRVAAEAMLQGARRRQNVLVNQLDDIGRRLGLAKIKKVKLAMPLRIAKITAGVGAILSIVGVALAIRDVRQRKKYLEEQKVELKQHLDDFNSFIAEANDDTKNLIIVFSTYFNEFEIDFEGVFNENQDGFLDESGQQKFDDAVSQLRAALNGAVKGIGELNFATTLANKRIERYLSQGVEGTELIEEVIFDTELPEEVIQRLYLFKLRNDARTVQEAMKLSGLPEDLVKKLYARGYLDDGKTVEEVVELSGLTEDQVRRVFAGKLLDDRQPLNIDNQDDFFGIKAIAEQAGISEDIVLEIQAQKIPNLLSDSEESELEPELVTT